MDGLLYSLEFGSPNRAQDILRECEEIWDEMEKGGVGIEPRELHEDTSDGTSASSDMKDSDEDIGNWTEHSYDLQ